MSANTLETPSDKTIYTPDEIALLDPKRIPHHVAIMMDGNRRWATQRGLPPTMGHWEGAETLTDIVRAASELGIKTITVYAFSTENWGRPPDEVLDVMKIFELYLSRKKEFMVKEGVRLDAIGDLSKMPPEVQLAFQETKQATLGCDKINLVLALNYGGRDEIRRAVIKIIEEKISPDEITEACIGAHLDTFRFGDPELLIRTSGEMRLSNFLLWQVSYAEIVSTPVHWPSFSAKDLYEALLVFQKRRRRLGG